MEPQGRKSSSRRRRWQSLLAAAVLIAAGTCARADTADGVAALKRGEYIHALAELEGPAKAGDPVAQANLGAIYHYGLGVPADFTSAFKWYRAAALQGNVDGELGLAVLYAFGKGVEPDLAIARMWLSVAADAMPPSPDRLRVSEDLDAIAKRLTPADLKRSDDLVKAWYATRTAP
jgi:TPR repeat protein